MEACVRWLKKGRDHLLRRDDTGIALHVCFAAFAGISLFLTLYRNPWRDEGQAWLLARDLSPWALFLEARHEGHPILWHLCLKLLQFFGSDYLGMMLLNWLFMVSAIWLLFYRSTVPLAARVAVALCPVSLLEVSCNARNYAISACLIFLAASLYRDVAKKPILFSIVLALLANTNLFAAAVFAGISLQFLLEQAWNFGNGPVSLRPLYSRYLASNLILLAGSLLLVAQLIPLHLAGEPPIHAHPLGIHRGDLVRPVVALFLVSASLVFFFKRRGCPRIYGGILISALALVPTLILECDSRHRLMITLGIVYFIWIYLDDILASYAEARQIFVKGAAALLIITACVLSKHTELKSVFTHSWDSKATAQAIIAHHLDEPDTLMVATQPNVTTAVLMLLKNVRTDYGPAPYPQVPLSFTDVPMTEWARSKPTPTLEDLKPLVLKLAEANPTKTIIVVSNDFDEIEKAPDDPDYQLVPIYMSPMPKTGLGYLSEYFQVYVLKR